MFVLLKIDCKPFFPLNDVLLLSNALKVYVGVMDENSKSDSLALGFFVFALIHGTCCFFEMGTPALRKLEQILRRGL